jgi:hypothetical protein
MAHESWTLAGLVIELELTNHGMYFRPDDRRNYPRKGISGSWGFDLIDAMVSAKPQLVSRIVNRPKRFVFNTAPSHQAGPILGLLHRAEAVLADIELHEVSIRFITTFWHEPSRRKLQFHPWI